MPGAVFLEGDAIELRTYEKEDMEFVRDAYNSEGVWRSMFDRRPFNLKELENGFDAQIEDDKIRLMICLDEEPIGIVFTNEISRTHGKAEIAIWLKNEAQGKGYGKESLEMFVDYLFNELRLHKLSAEVLEFNEASKELLERIGLKREAVLKEEIYAEGKHQDLIYFGITSEEWQK